MVATSLGSGGICQDVKTTQLEFFESNIFYAKRQMRKKTPAFTYILTYVFQVIVGRPQENKGDKKVVEIKFFAVELPNHVTIPPLLINCI
jgi:hypothetical protein